MFITRMSRVIGFRECLYAGLVTQAVSVFIISYGVHLKTQSDRFEEHERSVENRIIAKNPGKDLAPGLAVGMAAASSWMFHCCVMYFFTFACTFSLLVLHAIALYSRVLAIGATGGFCLFCLWFAYAILQGGWHAWEWGFITLAAGEILTAIGLLLTVIGAPCVVLRTDQAQPRTSVPGGRAVGGAEAEPFAAPDRPVG
jgi:hypothetical protein